MPRESGSRTTFLIWTATPRLTTGSGSGLLVIGVVAWPIAMADAIAVADAHHAARHALMRPSSFEKAAGCREAGLSKTLAPSR
jgi:hypothetical protein